MAFGPTLVLALLVREVVASSYADGGSGMACWNAKMMVECASTFPGVALDVDWGVLTGPAAHPVEDDLVEVNASLSWPSSLNVTTRSHGFAIDHANLHSCLTVAGFCSPFVSEQPQLVTHSTELRSHAVASHGDVMITSRLGAADTWMIIVHYRIFVSGVRADFATGTIVRVRKRETEHLADKRVKLLATVVISVGMLLSSAMLLAILRWRKTRLLAASSWHFIAVSALGAIVVRRPGDSTPASGLKCITGVRHWCASLVCITDVRHWCAPVNHWCAPVIIISDCDHCSAPKSYLDDRATRRT